MCSNAYITSLHYSDLLQINPKIMLSTNEDISSVNDDPKSIDNDATAQDPSSQDIRQESQSKELFVDPQKVPVPNDVSDYLQEAMKTFQANISLSLQETLNKALNAQSNHQYQLMSSMQQQMSVLDTTVQKFVSGTSNDGNDTTIKFDPLVKPFNPAAHLPSDTSFNGNIYNGQPTNNPNISVPSPASVVLDSGATWSMYNGQPTNNPNVSAPSQNPNFDPNSSNPSVNPISPEFVPSANSNNLGFGRQLQLRPDLNLQTSLKSIRIPILTNMVSTFPIWWDRVKSIFTSVYLSCLTEIIHHKVPKSHDEWISLDNSWESRNSEANSLIGIRNGIPPRPIGNPSIDTLSALNGMFNSVISYCPSLVESLTTLIVNSLDSSVRHFAPTRGIVSAINVKTMYFKILNHFLLTTKNAKSRRLLDFGKNVKFTRNDSPEIFANNLLRERKDINDMFTKDAIPMEVLNSVFVESIQLVALDIYETILDNIQYELDGKPANFLVMVDKLNNKYLDRRSRTPGNVPQVFVAHEPKSGGKSLKSKPCFNFQRDKECSYGEKCKFSHDPSICDSVLLTFSDVQEQCVFHTGQADAFRKRAVNTRAKYTKSRNNFNEYKKIYQNNSANTADQKSALDKIKNQNISYEDAVHLDETNLKSTEKANVAHTNQDVSFETTDDESITDSD